MSKTAVLSETFEIAVPEQTVHAFGWVPGQFAFIPKGAGLLMVKVPSKDELRGFARGASNTGYRDRYNGLVLRPFAQEIRRSTGLGENDEQSL